MDKHLKDLQKIDNLFFGKLFGLKARDTCKPIVKSINKRFDAINLKYTSVVNTIFEILEPKICPQMFLEFDNAAIKIISRVENQVTQS